MKKTIALFYGHASSNYGDLAINMGLVELLQKICPNHHLHVIIQKSKHNQYLNSAKLSFRQHKNISFSLFRANNNKSEQYLNNPRTFLGSTGTQDADVVLLNSGEHLFSYPSHHNSQNLFWRILPAYAAAVAGKRCILLPSTLGPFNKEGSELIGGLINSVDSFSARDQESMQYLLEFSQSIPLLLDPGFWAAEGVPNPKHKKEQNVLVMRSESWGIRIPTRERGDLTNYKELNGGLSSKTGRSLVRFFLENTSQPVLIVVQTKADELLAKTMVDEFVGESRVSIAYPKTTYEYIKHLVQGKRVVSSRLHALIIALSMNIPAYGIYFEQHGHKMKGVFRLLELENKTKKIIQNEEQAEEFIRKSLKDEERYIHDLHSSVLQNKVITEQCLQEQLSCEVKDKECRKLYENLRCLIPKLSRGNKCRLSFI